MSLEHRLEKLPITSFGFFSRKTMASDRPGDSSMVGPLVSMGLSGRMEGLRRPCRCQSLCLLDPSPGTAAASLPASAGLLGSRRWGQLDAFSRRTWPGLSGCLAGPTSDLLRPLLPSCGAVLLQDPLAGASDSSESPGSKVGRWTSGVHGVVGEEGCRRAVMLLKARPGGTSLLHLPTAAKVSVARPVAGGQETRPAEGGVDTVHSSQTGLGLP